MKLAYLLNSYPRTSTTFIRRELEAIEALGQPVTRFAVRHWDEALVDPDDIAELGRTEYLLTGGMARLIASAVAESVKNAPRVARLLPLWWRTYRAAGGGLVRHIAYLLQAMRFRRRAATLGIDHVHVHFSTNATTVAMLAHALGGPRYSFTVHGPDELLDPPGLNIADKMRRAAFVVAITDFCRNRLELEAPELADRIIVVRCGLELADYPLAGDPAPDPARLVCVGRLCINKAQALIPAAIAQVRDEFPGLVIDFVGDGEHRAALLDQARRHGVERHVNLVGWASADDVRRHIRASSALLLPSLAEGLPIVLMEALAMGRPVLTTYIAGIPELVDDGCGWIFPPGSVDAIAAGLRAALSATDAQRHALGAEGRRRVEDRHDIRRSARLLLDAMRAAGSAPGAEGGRGMTARIHDEDRVPPAAIAR